MQAVEDSRQEVRDAVAELIEDTASWREYKAAEYPEDVRNVHCVRALRMAAQYVRALPLADDIMGPLGPFFEFDRQIYDWKQVTPRELIYLGPREIMNPGIGLYLHTGGSDACSRFFFENEPRLPSERDFHEPIQGGHRFRLPHRGGAGPVVDERRLARAEEGV